MTSLATKSENRPPITRAQSRRRAALPTRASDSRFTVTSIATTPTMPHSASNNLSLESWAWVFVLLGATYLLWSAFSRPRSRPALRSVAILVLGDIGRSPRMMYHAESFAKNNFLTYLVGYGGMLSVAQGQDSGSSLC